MKYVVSCLLCLALGCAQEHELHPQQSGTAGASGEAGSQNAGLGGAAPDQAGQGGQGVDPQTRALILDWLAQYDRQVTGLCKCQVGWGDFQTLEQCFGLIGSNESWRTCFLKAAAEMDTSSLVTVAMCQTAQSRARADCFEAMGTCTKQNVGNCSNVDNMCPMLDPQSLAPLIAACPQTILLR